MLLTKKICAIIGFCSLYLLPATYTHAQQASIGISAGALFSTPTVRHTTADQRYSSLTDAAFGFFGQYNLSPKFALVFDAGAANRGSRYQQSVVRVSEYDNYAGPVAYATRENKYEHQLLYLDNHLLGKYTYTFENKLKLYAQAGIYQGILLRARTFVNEEHYDADGTHKPTQAAHKQGPDLKNLYKKTDMGFSLGLGIEYGRIGLDYRYHLGVANIAAFADGTKIVPSFSTLKLMFKFCHIAEPSRYSRSGRVK
jgi:hypothetical protein